MYVFDLRMGWKVGSGEDSKNGGSSTLLFFILPENLKFVS